MDPAIIALITTSILILIWVYKLNTPKASNTIVMAAGSPSLFTKLLEEVQELERRNMISNLKIDTQKKKVEFEESHNTNYSVPSHSVPSDFNIADPFYDDPELAELRNLEWEELRKFKMERDKNIKKEQLPKKENPSDKDFRKP